MEREGGQEALKFSCYCHSGGGGGSVWSNTNRVVVAQTVLTLVIYERKEGGEDVTQLQLREEAL